MQAVVIATGHEEALRGTRLREAPPLLPCVDRPGLQHVVELLVEQGITEFHFVLHEAPDKIESFLGDGKRWGSVFKFQLARNADQPYRVLRLLNFADGVMLVHADRLPLLSSEQFASIRKPGSMMLCSSAMDGGPSVWTGWARVDADILELVPPDANRAQLEAVLSAKLSGHGIELVPQTAEIGTLDGLIEAQKMILSGALPGIHLSARQSEPGVWIARNVVIHPTAILTSPLFIGENARIGAGARIGPNAVVGHDSVVDRHTSIRDAMVYPGSYCGEGLELDRVFIDRNRLIDIGLQTEVHISDSFILGSLKQSISRGWTARLISRMGAAVLFILTLPLLAGVWLIRSKAFTRREVVRLPASAAPESWVVFPVYSFARRESIADSKAWRRILFDVLPNLLHVTRGRMALVGVEARSPEQISQLPEDWRALYLQSRAGLVTEAGVVYGAAASEDDIYSSEAYYSATSGLRHDLELAVRYLLRGLRNA